MCGSRPAWWYAAAPSPRERAHDGRVTRPLGKGRGRITRPLGKGLRSPSQPSPGVGTNGKQGGGRTVAWEDRGAVIDAGGRSLSRATGWRNYGDQAWFCEHVLLRPTAVGRVCATPNGLCGRQGFYGIAQSRPATGGSGVLPALRPASFFRRERKRNRYWDNRRG